MPIESKQEIEIDNRDLVISHLKDIERDLGWLSKKTDIPYPTLYSCFIQRLFKISEDNLKEINRVLGTKFKNNKD